MPPKIPRKIEIRKGPGGQQAVRKVRLPDGRLVERRLSPAQAFIRTGEKLPGLNEAQTKALGTRFLGREWYEQAKGVWNPGKKPAVSEEARRAQFQQWLETRKQDRRGKVSFAEPEWMKQAKKGGEKIYPLPTQRGRLSGGYLPKADLAQLDKQVRFTVNTFARGLPPERKQELLDTIYSRLRSNFGRTLSVSSALREKTPNDITQMREQGIELHGYLQGKGREEFGKGGTRGDIYPGIMKEWGRGRSYIPKGGMQDRQAPENKVVGIHEAIHGLQQMGVLKADVPFAEVGQMLYALETGMVRNPKFRDPTPKEFNYTPRLEPEQNLVKPAPGVPFRQERVFTEPEANYKIGDRIGAWVYRNLPEGRRWDYVYRRCMGESHENALRAVR